MNIIEAKVKVTDLPADVPVTRIEASGGMLWPNLSELWAYRELLYFLVWRDVKVRYKQTAIGVAWAIIQPLMTMLIFSLVFSRIANVSSNGLPYPIFNFAGLLPWNFFSKALNQSILSVVSNSQLITKIYFPRILLPLSSTLSGIIDFGIGLAFLLGMMAWYGIAPRWSILLLPGFLLLTILATLAISFWLGVVNVRYRDVGQAVPLLLQVWLFASPVAYPVSALQEKWQLFYSLNPLTGIIEGFRWAAVGNQDPPVFSMILSIGITTILFLGGIVFFQRMERTFADEV